MLKVCQRLQFKSKILFWDQYCNIKRWDWIGGSQLCSRTKTHCMVTRKNSQGPEKLRDSGRGQLPHLPELCSNVQLSSTPLYNYSCDFQSLFLIISSLLLKLSPACTLLGLSTKCVGIYINTKYLSTNIRFEPANTISSTQINSNLSQTHLWPLAISYWS